MTRMTGGPRTRWSLPRWVMAAVAAGAAGALPPPVWLRRPLAPRHAHEVVPGRGRVPDKQGRLQVDHVQEAQGRTRNPGRWRFWRLRMLGILNCCPRALPHKHDGLVFPLRERLQRRDIVLVVRIGCRISRLASRLLADLAGGQRAPVSPGGAPAPPTPSLTRVTIT